MAHYIQIVKPLAFLGSEDGCVYVWNTDSAALAHRYEVEDLTEIVHDVAFHPHDNILAVCCCAPGRPLLLYYAG